MIIKEVFTSAASIRFMLADYYDNKIHLMVILVTGKKKKKKKNDNFKDILFPSIEISYENMFYEIAVTDFQVPVILSDCFAYYTFMAS